MTQINVKFITVTSFKCIIDIANTHFNQVLKIEIFSPTFVVVPSQSHRDGNKILVWHN